MKTRKSPASGAQLTVHLAPFSLIVGVGALVFVGGFWGLIFPRIKSIAQLTQQVEQGRATAITTPKKQQASQTSLDSVTKLEVLLPVMNQLIPVGDRRYDLTSELESLTSKQEVKLSGVSYTPGVSAPRTTGVATDGPSPYATTPLPRLNVGFSVTGTYEQIQRFTEQAYRTNRFMEIDQISLSPTAGGDQLTAAFNMVAWYVEGVKAQSSAAPATNSVLPVTPKANEE